LLDATVDATDHVRLKTVTIARDLGSTLEINAGLTAQDRVIQSPPDGLSDGIVVRIAGNAEALSEQKGRHGKDKNAHG
jgi:hypothetical protein